MLIRHLTHSRAVALAVFLLGTGIAVPGQDVPECPTMNPP